MNEDLASAVLTIDLGAIVANWRQLAAMAGPAVVTAAVVKADAYGLGAVPVAQALARAGCRRFIVAQIEEALIVRAALPDAEILSLGGLTPGGADVFEGRAIIPVLNHRGEIAAWADHARARGRRLAAAIHIDTGMNRLGLESRELDQLAEDPGPLEGLAITAWISHLACAESPVAMNGEQRARFQAALARLPAAPASLANSSGVFLGSDWHFQMIRPGAALYGINPTPGRPNPMRAAVRLDARVLQARNVDSPQSVGYGASHRVAGRGKIATIAVGYADGYARALSGRGHVFVDGVPAPVVGRISMDLTTADVSACPEGAITLGRLVEVIGPHRDVDQVAAEAGTIGYEILTSLGRRYARVYRNGDA